MASDWMACGSLPKPLMREIPVRRCACFQASSRDSPFATTIDGDESLRRRPMKRIIEPLVKMGAGISARDDSFAPLSISGGGLKGIEYTPPVASAQVKSAVLLAGLFAVGKTTVIEKTPTRNHTEIMLLECGIPLDVVTSEQMTRISFSGPGTIRPLGDYTVAGDISSAAFFLVAGLVVPDSRLRLEHIGVNPSRRALIDGVAIDGRADRDRGRAARPRRGGCRSDHRFL
jgi:3-phosphoshikimate 1-carboxyvinyltransferase